MNSTTPSHSPEDISPSSSVFHQPLLPTTQTSSQTSSLTSSQTTLQTSPQSSSQQKIDELTQLLGTDQEEEEEEPLHRNQPRHRPAKKSSTLPITINAAERDDQFFLPHHSVRENIVHKANDHQRQLQLQEREQLQQQQQQRHYLLPQQQQRPYNQQQQEQAQQQQQQYRYYLQQQYLQQQQQHHLPLSRSVPGEQHQVPVSTCTTTPGTCSHMFITQVTFTLTSCY